jgi:hypothetical protein
MQRALVGYAVVLKGKGQKAKGLWQGFLPCASALSAYAKVQAGSARGHPLFFPGS